MTEKEAIEFVLRRAFTEKQLNVLRVFKRYNIVTPTIVTYEVNINIKDADLVLQQLCKKEVIEKIHRGYYKLTEIGAKVISLL